MIPVGETVLLEFCSLVAQRLGLWFDEHRREFLAGVLRERADGRGCRDPEAYLRTLADGGWADEWPALSGLLSVTETYFFRGQEHFRALVETVLPEHRRRAQDMRRLRLLSAGCASGEEAYSLAIALKEHAPWLEDWQVEITGLDANREMLAKARSGLYTVWSLRETPPEIREKYFQSVRQGFLLDEKIRGAVVFNERNLAAANDDLWRPGAFDVVFCRNMLMYFTPESAAALVARIGRALTPGGTLFLGHAETLRGLSQAFHLRRDHGAFYYQLRGENETPARVPADGSLRPPAPLFTAVPDLSTAWVEEIGRASAKIAVLSAKTRKTASPVPTTSPAPGPSAASGAINRVLDLHRQERFTDALTHLQELPAGAAPDADMQVLRAVLLVNCGRLDEAEALCRPLLGRDDLNAGAHYVTALCREQAGDLAAAEEHDARAVYLDPFFAMPRFHLGLMCKRLGRVSEALAHFGEALALLVKEDPVRLLLFGGGFSRETLVQVCRSELQRMKGSR